MEKSLRAYDSTGLIIFNGYCNEGLLEPEQIGDNILLHVWFRESFIGIVSCNKYELNDKTGGAK